MSSGGLISKRPLAYSDDGKLLLAPCGRAVKIFSAVTGEQVGTLDGHTADVTCAVLNPRDKKQVRCRKMARCSTSAS